MIKVDGRQLIIPKTDEAIGFVGDNLVEIREFELDLSYYTIDLTLLEFKLDIEADGQKNIIDLDKTVLEDKIILTWTVLEAHLMCDGLAKIQVRGFSGTLVKWHSEVEYVLIDKSINASDAFPDPLPSAFEEMEVRITAAKNTAVEASENATLKAGEAFTSAEEAATSAAAAKQSEINAGKAEEAALLAIAEAEGDSLLAIGTAKDSALLSIGTKENEALLAVGNKGNEQVSRVNLAGDTQVARVESVLEDIVVVGKTAPDFGIWLEEV